MDTSSQLYSTNTSKPMGEAVGTSGIRSRNMENMSLEISKYPRDLLQRFLGTNPLDGTSSRGSDDFSIGGGRAVGDMDEDDGGLNLGLGLSLGGKFGVDKSHKGLIRSSSVVGTMPLIRDEDKTAPPTPAPVQGLARTASLPVETEEEWRKRKEIQTLRRLEAKRRRFEKQRVLKEGSSGGGGEEKGVVDNLNFKGRLEREQQCLGLNNNKPVGGGSTGNPFLSSTSNVGMKRRTTFGSLHGFLAQAQAQAQAQTQTQPQVPIWSPAQAQVPVSVPVPVQAQQGCSQGSVESQGGSSSAASEFESKTNQGSSSAGESRSSTSIHSSQEYGTKGEGTQRASGPGPEAEGSSKQPEVDNKRRETVTVSGGGMEDMPCVFTIGDGPNGRKVEGILYRYGKGEEVRIMCVCHGSFFSPADFVKHAGGRDVEHPLRHIVVSPTASPFQ